MDERDRWLDNVLIERFGQDIKMSMLICLPAKARKSVQESGKESFLTIGTTA